MATIRDILGQKRLDELVAAGKSDDEIIAIATQTHKQTKSPAKPTPSYFDTHDNTLTDFAKAGATNTARLLNFADGAGEYLGLDLVPDHLTKKMNNVTDEIEQEKQKRSRKDLNPQRLKELNDLDKESAAATGVVDNVIAGAKSMVDTAMHPEEWTRVGVFETLTDPLNAISFGTGSLASKLGRTFAQRVVIGTGAGATEAAAINSGTEYLIAKGAGKPDEEAKKIALQSLGGGAVAGAGFGSLGALANRSTNSNKTTDSTNPESVKDEILENDLLDQEQVKETFSAEFENTKLDDKAMFQVDEAYKRGDILEQDYSPDFIIVQDNLPALLNELVETEIIEPYAAKQIEYKNKKIALEHRNQNVIYANYEGWSESIGQHIVDALNAKRINDTAKAEDLSVEYIENQRDLVQKAFEAGTDSQTIKDQLNSTLKPTKEEMDISMILNSSPVENRFAGLRIREALKASMNDLTATPETDLATLIHTKNNTKYSMPSHLDNEQKKIYKIMGVTP